MNTADHFQVLKLLGEGSYGKVMLAVHRKRGSDREKAMAALALAKPPNSLLCSPGTPMALKCFPRDSTSLHSFLKEYNFSLSFCTHPSLTSALGIAYFTPSHYIFAQQAGLYGDLYSVILPEVPRQLHSRLQDFQQNVFASQLRVSGRINGWLFPGWPGGELLPAGGVPAVRSPVPPAFSWIRPQRSQTGKRLLV